MSSEGGGNARGADPAAQAPVDDPIDPLPRAGEPDAGLPSFERANLARPPPRLLCEPAADPLWKTWNTSNYLYGAPSAVFATRGDDSVAVSFTATGQPGGPFDAAFELFDDQGGRILELKVEAEVQAEVQLHPLVLAQNTLVFEESSSLSALDVRTGTRLWSSDSFAQQLTAMLGPDVKINDRVVADLAGGADRLVFAPGGGSRVAHLDVQTGGVTVSPPMPYVLIDPVGDEAQRLFAPGHRPGTFESGVASFDRNGSVAWFFPRPNPAVEGAFDGRVYLADGAVLDAASGELLYEVAGGLANVWITHERLYVPRLCEPFEPGAEACLEILAMRPSDGALLWSRKIADDEFSNLAVGRDLSVHVVGVQIIPPDSIGAGTDTTPRHVAFDKDGREYAPCLALDGNMRTELVQLGQILVTQEWNYYGDFTYAFASAQRATEDLIPPAGWIPKRGSRSADFRPEFP